MTIREIWSNLGEKKSERNRDRSQRDVGGCYWLSGTAGAAGREMKEYIIRSKCLPDVGFAYEGGDSVEVRLLIG